ncbi:MAG: DnaJ C-terminal domain-containing protein [Methylococcales bacterium]
MRQKTIRMQQKDYYKILGIDRNATQNAIKTAYRKLARKFHPDISKEKNAEERFKELGEAYEVLKDPGKRTAYDRIGKTWQSTPDFRQPPGWRDGFGFSKSGLERGSKSGISDFFESLLNWSHRWSSGTTAKRWFAGKDHHAKIQIDLSDSCHGANRRLTLRIPMQDSHDSPQSAERVLDIRIPKGIKAGQRIRLAGQGLPGIRGSRNGDLYLEIEFRPHPFFTVKGSDVYLDLPVAPWEAALGAPVKIPTPEGSAELKIPAGSKQSSRIRLKDRGIPGSPSGHLYVTLQIVLPPADSEKAKRVYRNMARELSFNPRKVFGNLK